MAFGTAERLKSDVAGGVAIVVARLAAAPRRARGAAHLRRAGPSGCSRRAAAAAGWSRCRVVAEGVAADGHAPGEGALGAGLRRIGRLARGPGLVVVISDFRAGGPAVSPPPWSRELGALARATTCSPSRSSTRARASCPTPGTLVLVDPETGARRGRLLQRRAAPRFAAAELARRDALRRALRRARARHVEVRTDGDWLRALGGGAAMSFQAPLFLLALLAIPLALAALALARRRPDRYVVRFPATATLGAVLPRDGRAARAADAAAVPRARRAGARAGAAGGDRRRAERARVGDARDRHVGLDERDRRRAVAAGRRQGRGRALPRRGARPAARRARRLRRRHAHTSCARPPTTPRCARRSTACSAEGGTATGDALTGALEALGERGETRRRPRSCCSPTARRPDRARSRRGGPRARAAGVPVSTVALGTPDGSLSCPTAASSGSRPTPESLREIAQVSGGRAYAAEDAGALEQVYEDLGSQIGTRPEQREITAGVAGAGVLLLLGALGTGWRRRGVLA